jgi:hypothetical protein
VWVIDSMTTTDGPAIGTGLLHSADGGDHFSLEAGLIPGIACSYSPASGTVVWAYCSGGHFMFAYRSADGGAYFISAGRSGTPAVTPSGSTLVAASSGTAVVANDLSGSPLVRTIDKGAKWNAVQAAPDTSGTWSLIGFTTPEAGNALWEHDGATYQASPAQLWRTTDAGASWAAVAALP